MGSGRVSPSRCATARLKQHRGLAAQNLRRCPELDPIKAGGKAPNVARHTAEARQ